ncbi:MAG: CAP domain-containing protein, partial [Anaerolineales bacterium]|nr:CAP domain-containing protein [Anaerolineales bacterium]
MTLSTGSIPSSEHPEKNEFIPALSYPPDPTSDIGWSAGTSGVADIQTAFNNARTVENGQLGSSMPMMTLPNQTQWNGMSDGERALWLINRERIDRGLAPLDGLETNVNGVAQYYADYLLDNNTWGHSADGRSPWDRLNDNPSIGACHDFLSIAENLAVFVTSGSSISLPIERSIYMWMYDDASSTWGHRHAILWYPYNDNGGQAGREGFLGIGRANGGPYKGPFSQPWPFAEMIVMNVFDPCATWAYPGPVVNGITRADANPTSADSVRFNVTFSKAVTGVDQTDFGLSVSGVSGTSITSVSGSGVAYIVTVNTGSGSGTIRLNLVDNDSIKDVNNIPLGGAGTGNGNYTSGETYTINKLFTITGNAGTGGTILSYVDGTSKTVTAGPDGDYTITVSKYWTGTVTPAHPCYTFTPSNRTYPALTANQTGQDYTATFNPASGCANVNVNIGGNSLGNHGVPVGGEARLYFNASGGPVKVESTNDKNIVSAIRLQSFVGNTLYSFVETMGVPQGLLSHKYYFPTYNNTWAPLNSQVRFGNLDAAQTRIRVTIGGVNVWEEDVPGLQERRLTFNVSGGPVVIESLDPSKKIVAAIRLQSFDLA